MKRAKNNSKKFNKQKRSKNCQPPFSWPLILFLLIFAELMLLTKERAWSQNYVNVVNQLRDQVDAISSENQKLYNNIYNFYNQIFALEAENNNYLVKTQREFLNLPQHFSFIIKNHNE
jgi:hypothetical protein